MAGLATAASLAMAPPAAAVPADFQARADAYLKSVYGPDAPGAAVIVVEDGKTVYTGAQGAADIAAGRKLTADTVFRLGSITKQFTAAVILQLAQEGKLALSDPLSKFLPDYPMPGGQATVTQLLNHTSGIQSYTGIPGFMEEANTARAFTTEQLIAEFKDQPDNFERGTAFRYNNSGYVLLGAIIEKVTGQPWHVAIDERIAGPLGLKTIRHGSFETQTPAMAVGYGEEDGSPVLARKIDMSVPHAAGALIGTVGDLARWAQALHHGKVVDADSYALMIAPTTLSDGSSNPYAFGLANGDIRERPSIGHGGGIFGFSTASEYLPGEDLFVAVFANSNAPATAPTVVMRRIAALALGDPYPTFEKAAVDPAALELLFGVYALDEGERRFYQRDGKLYTRRSGGSELEVFAAGDDRFFYGGDALTWFAMRRDADGAHVMAMHHDGAKTAETAVRSGPIPAGPDIVELPRSALERFIGSYQARLGLATIAFGDGDRLTIRLGGQQPAVLTPIGPAEFLVEGVDARVSFSGEGEAASGLLIKQGGQEIAAERVAS